MIAVVSDASHIGHGLPAVLICKGKREIYIRIAVDLIVGLIVKDPREGLPCQYPSTHAVTAQSALTGMEYCAPARERKARRRLGRLWLPLRFSRCPDRRWGVAGLKPEYPGTPRRTWHIRGRPWLDPVLRYKLPSRHRQGHLGIRQYCVQGSGRNNAIRCFGGEWLNEPPDPCFPLCDPSGRWPVTPLLRVAFS